MKDVYLPLLTFRYLCRMPDPNAHRPADWDTRKAIVDEDAVKPAGWLDNEPTTIPNKGERTAA